MVVTADRHRDEGIGVKLHFRVQPGQLVSHRPFLHQNAEKNENFIFFSEGVSSFLAEGQDKHSDLKS